MPALDLYKVRAARIFGVAYEAVAPAQRRFAKTMSYARWYSA